MTLSKYTWSNYYKYRYIFINYTLHNPINKHKMDASKTGAKKDQFVGNAKDTFGGAVGNNSLQSEGKAQNASGSLEEGIATVQGYVSGAASQVEGAVKGAYNALVGDNSGEAAAKATKAKGETQKEWNS